MGLLNRAIAFRFHILFDEFHRKNPVFHGVVMRLPQSDGTLKAIADMTLDHGAACIGLDDGNCLLLLPGGLDRELFAHRISHSTHSVVLCQNSFNSPPSAIQTLRAYLR